MFSIKAIFGPDYERYEGVRPINIYLLRLLFLLVVVFVASDSWSTILKHQGQWDHVKAAAVCMWAAYSVLSIFGFNFWFDQSSQVASDCDVRDLLQDHLARHRGIPAVVNKSTGRLAGRRNDACICMGYSAHRGDALGLCVQDLRLAVEEEQMIPHHRCAWGCESVGG